MNVARDPWSVIWHPRPTASVTAILFHPACSGASFFRALSAEVAESIECVSVQLPGRENRYREPLVTDWEIIQKPILDLIKSRPSKPVVLFGHSLGAHIAYRAALAIEEDQPSHLHHLCVSSAAAPLSMHAANLLDVNARHADDVVLKQFLIDVNGTDPEIISSDEILEMLLPVLRADLILYENLKNLRTEVTSCDITALGGASDRTVSDDKMRAWAGLTNKYFNQISIPGGHFYIRAQTEQVARYIDECASRLLGTVIPSPEAE